MNGRTFYTGQNALAVEKGPGRPDRVIIILTAALVFLGALMIYSSTSVITYAMQQKQITTPLFYFKRHLITIFLALLAASVAYRIRTDLLGKLSPVLLFLSLALLLLVFTRLGISAGGARRWLRLWPSTFQPSELVKLSMVIFLAWYLSRDFFDPDNLPIALAPLGVMAVFQAVFLKQPDFGGALTLGVITICMLFLAGVRLRYLAGLLLLALPLAYYLAHEPYRLRRITSFLDPWAEARGDGFQLVQSFIALGRGGFGGVGLGRSMQKLSFLPEMHTDFIFSIIGEELGFMGATLVVLAFAGFFLRSTRIAGRMGDKYRQLLAYGIALMIALPAMVNFGVVTGLLPTKGLPLPFISYGGSSLIVNLMAVGILLRLSKGEAMADARQDKFRETIERKKARRAIYGAGL
ncbi:MAG: putative lipid II flippase FtsW [Nitrospiraceae bacterium]|nr:putative lipid II flippase FtsW [Nitrospiraceae bacterium]